MITILALKFLVGGTFVVAFALISQMIKPHTVAGIFSAAPSIALANLGIGFATKGPAAMSQEGIGMLAGSVAMVAYVLVAEPAVRRWSSFVGSAVTLLAWVIVAIAGYGVVSALTG